MMRPTSRYTAVITCALLLLGSSTLIAQDDAAPADEEVSAAASLAAKQSRIADKYRRLEELMFKMEQLERGANPQRAKLLREAVEHGREEGIQLHLNALVRRLTSEEYKLAIDGQGQVRTELQALLELLQKEDRARRNASEQARIKEYIRELDRLIRKERSIQGRTEGGAEPKDLSKEQGDLSDRTGDLADKIRENEEQGAKPDGEGEPQEGQPQEGQPQEGQPQEGEPQRRTAPGRTAPGGPTTRRSTAAKREWETGRAAKAARAESRPAARRAGAAEDAAGAGAVGKGRAGERR